jgi:hypothetical protein
MTEHDHLDDEAISAVLDGEATADEVAHVDACATCAARLGELRDAALFVRTPVEPPSDTEREAAIAAVLAPTTATVTPIRRAVPRWLGAAAAALAVLAGIGVFAGVQRDRDHAKESAASDTAAGGATSRAAPAPEASAFATAVYEGGDLGDIDVRSLRTTIESALSPSRSSAAQATAGSGAGATANDSAASTTAPRTPACEDAVRSGNPDLGPLLYRATGRVDGEPVEVFAFDAGGKRWVYVVAIGGCAIKNQTTYSA